uniref:DUF7769 domain-containing protein n=1 Tax=Oryza glumipatula TaxID=40148 RepID=A0A0D9ZUD1_9ORYZ
MAEDGDGEFAFDLNETPLEHGNGRKDMTEEVRKQVYQALLARSKNGKLGKKDTRVVADHCVILPFLWHFFGIILPGSELTFALLVKHLEHNASGGGGVERERARPRDASDESGAGEHDASGGGGECDESSGGERDESAAGERDASGGESDKSRAGEHDASGGGERERRG